MRPFSVSMVLFQMEGVIENLTGTKHVRMQHLQGKSIIDFKSVCESLWNNITDIIGSQKY